jgi:hypothetical protein
VQIALWNEDASELGTLLARPKGVLISQVLLYQEACSCFHAHSLGALQTLTSSNLFSIILFILPFLWALDTSLARFYARHLCSGSPANLQKLIFNYALVLPFLWSLIISLARCMLGTWWKTVCYKPQQVLGMFCFQLSVSLSFFLSFVYLLSDFSNTRPICQFPFVGIWNIVKYGFLS